MIRTRPIRDCTCRNIAFAEVKTPKPERLCRGCGKVIRCDTIHCAECAADIRNKSFLDVAKVGRIAGHTPEAIAKEAASHRKHAEARATWNPAKQPAWLTEQFFSGKIQPALATTSATAIAKSIGVSCWYAGRIREGYRPHPRHWQGAGRPGRLFETVILGDYCCSHTEDYSNF